VDVKQHSANHYNNRPPSTQQANANPQTRQTLRRRHWENYLLYARTRRRPATILQQQREQRPRLTSDVITTPTPHSCPPCLLVKLVQPPSPPDTSESLRGHHLETDSHSRQHETALHPATVTCQTETALHLPETGFCHEAVTPSLPSLFLVSQRLSC